ncbi:MAG: aminotransferase class V-fold PLP-dependent enzyme, partial [Fermentimonas sp.]|nr:aminotransferase class V-fold PLP-dependent enzyme [Fermentimonas sp.]
MIDINKIRTDFPILAREVYGKPLVYLDNAATTQKPQCVMDKITEMYSTVNSNVHRGVHYLSQAATDEHEAARKTVQRFINANIPEEIVFTRGATESINLVASSFCRSFCKEGDEILITAMEHHSNIVPWQIQADIRGLKIKVIPINKDGELIMEE